MPELSPELIRLNRLDARQRAALSRRTREELTSLLNNWSGYHRLTSLSDAEWEAAVAGELDLSTCEEQTSGPPY
jgi:hypothetical protein